MIIDMHCHSRFTRGCDLDPKLLIKRAQGLGLDGICFTELNSIDGAAELHQMGKGAPVKVFVGMELATDRGHYLCYFPDPEAIPDPVQMWGSNHERPWPVRETLEKVAKMGGVIAAAHPYDRDTPPASGDFIYGLKGGLAAVESYNPRRKPHVNNLAAEAADSLRLPSIAGSDTRHDVAELGKAATVFQAPIENEKDLCAALQGGRFWPVIFGGIPPGLSSGIPAAPGPSGSSQGGPRRGGGDRRRGGRPHGRRPRG
ncbi:MAG TPA: PHP domain-containing protein [Myxococcales bacterium]|jgi:predicted metal-dependent phosphoesterase TrpH|nr:PHP domain-containing protein [Myxococcales bacterium]